MRLERKPFFFVRTVPGIFSGEGRTQVDFVIKIPSSSSFAIEGFRVSVTGNYITNPPTPGKSFNPIVFKSLLTPNLPPGSGSNDQYRPKIDYIPLLNPPVFDLNTQNGVLPKLDQPVDFVDNYTNEFRFELGVEVPGDPPGGALDLNYAIRFSGIALVRT